MFYFGKEEPITNNESLYQKRDGIPELIADRSEGLLLNRYSFVQKDNTKDGSLSILIGDLISQLGFSAFGIACWLVQLPTKSKLASRVIEKKYINQGWQVHLRNEHYLASKRLDGNDIETWPSLGADTSSSGVVIAMGNDDFDIILGSIDQSCSQFLAQTRYFVPERKFLRALKEKDLAVLYQVDDDLGNAGLVLVTAKFIDTTAIEKSVSIARTFEGESAYKVFV